MHEIQKKILKQLTVSEKSRYSAIKPPKIGGNQFAYHLKEVVDQGLVKKDGIYYSLTSDGERFADGISLKTFVKRAQPKIVTMVIVENNKNEVLFVKREKQPFIGLFSLPYGKLHLGERIQDAAIREISEKTSLSISEVEHCGDAYIAIYEQNEVLTHMLCHVFRVKMGKEAFIKGIDLKEGCFWEKVCKIDFRNYVPGTKEILGLIDNYRKEHFFKEIFVEV
ncbi:MAG: NUDIX domain-containing protein [bacterium]